MSASVRHMKESKVSVAGTFLLVLVMSRPSCMQASLADDTKMKQMFHIHKANLACMARIANEKLPADGGSYCEPVWDNLMCWPHYVRAGENVTQPCPSYIQGFNRLGKATRFCTADGTWHTHPSYNINTSWTDFSNCLQKSDPIVPAIIEKHMPIVIQISTIGYALSLGALIVATTIMVFFRKLHCQRNVIHINLFISFMLRAVISLLRNTLLVQHFALPNDIRYTEEGILVFIQEGTHWECKLLNTLWQYSLNANYMWIFVEGLYLHTLIFFAIFSHSTKFFKLYIVIGWVFPLIFIMFWVIARIFKNNTLCWNTDDKNYYWILNAPIISSISVNFFFFLNIIRVLFTKIRDCNTRDPRRYRKLAKSTLVLIPLFGVYYIIFILLSLNRGPRVSVIHMYMEMTLNSFQGTVVALLFCFLNGEVRSEIKKKWYRHWLRRQSVVSSRSSRAFSTASSYLGKERASLTQGLPLCDVVCKDNVASKCSYSNNGHGFHTVSSMPKLSLESRTSIKLLTRVSSSSELASISAKDVTYSTLNPSFPFLEEQLQEPDNEAFSNGCLSESPEDKQENILSDITTYLITDNCENTEFVSLSSPVHFSREDAHFIRDITLTQTVDSYSSRCPV